MNDVPQACLSHRLFRRRRIRKVGNELEKMEVPKKGRVIEMMKTEIQSLLRTRWFP